MNREDEILAELRALKGRVRTLTMLTVVLAIALFAMATYLFGIDGMAVITVCSALTLIIPFALVFAFIKVCKFRDHQMKNLKCEQEIDPAKSDT